MQPRRFLFAASLALLAGCSSDKKIGPNSLLGQLLFGYSGGIAGNFSASGAASTANPETSAWAAGVRDVPTTTLLVVASAPRTSTTHDVVILTIPRLTNGSSTVDVNCSANSCADLIVTFGSSNTGSTFLQFCVLETGTLAITSISDTRATGTFSGSGECSTATGTLSSFTVTGGTFDVALVSSVP